MQVGETIWVFDVNRRVYRRDKDGKAYGSPIWREHWVSYKVTGETSRSWLLEYGGKCPKKRDMHDMRKFAFSQAEIDERQWHEDHAHQIRRKVAYATLTTDQWKQIAAIIGYKENEGKG